MTDAEKELRRMARELDANAGRMDMFERGRMFAVMQRLLGPREVLALLDRIEALEKQVGEADARTKRLAERMDGFCGTIDAAELHFNNDGTGMQVPFHGDFARAKGIPSLERELKWWKSAFREALDATP